MRRESRITRLTKLYRRSLESELQLDEAFLKEAEKAFFSYSPARLRRYSATSPVEELEEAAYDLVDEGVIDKKDVDKFLDMVEEFYGASRIRSYADEGGSLAQDLAQAGIGVGTGTGFLTLLFMSLQNAAGLLQDPSSGVATKIAAIAMVVLVGLLSGRMYIFGVSGLYEAAKKLLRRSKPLFDRVYDLLMRLAKRLGGVKGIFGKVKELKKFGEENRDEIEEIASDLDKELGQ